MKHLYVLYFNFSSYLKTKIYQIIYILKWNALYAEKRLKSCTTKCRIVVGCVLEDPTNGKLDNRLYIESINNITIRNYQTTLTDLLN